VAAAEKQGCPCPRPGCSGDDAEVVLAECDRCGDARAVLWIDPHDSLFRNDRADGFRVSPRDIGAHDFAGELSPDQAPRRMPERSMAAADLAARLGDGDRVEIACRAQGCRGRREGRRIFRPTVGALLSAYEEVQSHGSRRAVLHPDNTVSVKMGRRGLAVPTIAGPDSR